MFYEADSAITMCQGRGGTLKKVSNKNFTGHFEHTELRGYSVMAQRVD